MTLYLDTGFIIFVEEVGIMDLKISELAEVCGINKETVRYYERKSLIPEPTRNKSGYRVYHSDTVNRVKFIKRMQRLGFSLSEIHKLLGVEDRDDIRCQDMYQFVSRKEDEVDRQIRDLQRVKIVLNDLKQRCPNEKDLQACPIIESLVDE